jgi:uncharacterized delta-60 repeat protein
MSRDRRLGGQRRAWRVLPLGSFGLLRRRRRRGRQRSFAALLVSVLLAGSALTTPALGADGDLDPTCDGDGKVTTDFAGDADRGTDVVVQADGKIVIAGRTRTTATNFDFALARYNPDGSLDLSFGADGTVTTDFVGGHDEVGGVAIQADGKIVAAGVAGTGSLPDFGVVRYNPDGSLDTSFDGDGKVITDFGGNDAASAIAIQSDGKILAAGGSSLGNPDFALARYNADGSLDTSFGGDGTVTTDFTGQDVHDLASGVAVQADGKIVAAGEAITTPSGDLDFAVVRYNPDGSLDTSFDGDGKASTDFGTILDRALGVDLQSDGKIVAAGSVTTDFSRGRIDFALARYNPNGSLDTAFSGDGKVTTDFAGAQDEAFAVAVQTDGKVVAAGPANTGSTFDFGIARYNANGSLDSGFSGDGKVATDFAGDDEAAGVAIQADGKIVAAGSAGTGTASDFALARYESGCPTTPYAWSPPTTTTGVGAASAPASDTLFNPKGGSYSYLAQGGTLLAIRNVADNKGPAGSIKWTWQPTTSAQLPSSPVPVLLPRGREVIFLTGADGFLYKLRASDGHVLGSQDTRRSSGGVPVCATDAVVASPAVQLYSLANSAFRTAVDGVRKVHDQLVFVITANGCGDTTENRVIAYWASDLSVAWTFNATGAFDVDRGFEACTVDYTRNLLFCATDHQEGSTSSLFAFNTLSGRLVWLVNTGAVLHRPVLLAGRLYVANVQGFLQAYDPAGGAPLWVSPMQVTGATVTRNPAAFVQGASRLLVVDTRGVLHSIEDDGNAGRKVWTVESQSFTSAPVAVPSLGKAYIGRGDGKVQQVDLTGQLEQVVTVGGLDSIVFDPALDVDPVTGADRLMVAAGGVDIPGKVTRLKLPLCDSPPGG